jgi:protein SCO1/2
MDVSEYRKQYQEELERAAKERPGRFDFINRSKSASIVNRHRVELFILDDKGRVAATFARLQWDVQEVLGQAKALLRDGGNEDATHPQQDIQHPPVFRQTMSASLFSMILSFLVAFFPKCPICWAAYMSVFGIAGLQSIPYSPWLLPVFILLMLTNLLLIYKRAKQRRGIEAFYLSLSGTLVILTLGLYFKLPYISYLGIALIFAGSLLSSLPFKTSFKLKSFIAWVEGCFGYLLRDKNTA